MPNNVTATMTESRKAFLELVVPPLLDMFGGKVLPVEGVDGELQRSLDREAGIDSLLFSPHGVYGIASRIQFDDNFRTFTIRKERASGATTEWSKLQNAMRQSSLMPSLTVQAYVESGRLLGAAVASTPDLVRWIETHPCEIRTTGWNQQGQAEFWVVPWVSLQDDESVRFRQLAKNT